MTNAEDRMWIAGYAGRLARRRRGSFLLFDLAFDLGRKLDNEGPSAMGRLARRRGLWCAALARTEPRTAGASMLRRERLLCLFARRIAREVITT